MSPLRTLTYTLAALLPVFGGPGCGPVLLPLDQPAGSDQQIDVNAGDSVLGIWERISGAILAVHQYTGFELEALVLRDDGTASAHFLEPDTGMVSCFSGEFQRTGPNGLILNVAGLTDVLLPDDTLGSTSQLLEVSQSDDDTLELQDSDAAIVRFARRSEVPRDLRCSSLRVVQRHTYGGVRLSSAGGMAYDGSLWFYDQSSDLVRSVNPQNGALGDGVELDRHQYVHAAQDGDFWAHCNCSGTSTPEIVRVTKDDEMVDEIYFEDHLNRRRLGHPRCIAAQGDSLLIQAFENDALQFVEIDVSGQPQVLRDAEFDYAVRAMVLDGDDLWAIVEGQRQMVVRFDVQSLMPEKTFMGLDPSIDWSGIAMVGVELFVLGHDDGSDAAVLMRAGTTLVPTVPVGPGSLAGPGALLR